jgi:CYTH domain-containing protein
VAVEIERRFLVADSCAAIRAANASSSYIIQGYFGCIDSLRVRVRILWDEYDNCSAFLTFKGARRGYCRLEYEYPLTLERAHSALDCLPSMQIIRKKRYSVQHHDGLLWSIDQFEGANNGLCIAEVELSHASQEFELPAWTREEITFNRRYGNSRLARSPIPSLADVA